MSTIQSGCRGFSDGLMSFDKVVNDPSPVKCFFRFTIFEPCGPSPNLVVSLDCIVVVFSTLSTGDNKLILWSPKKGNAILA